MPRVILKIIPEPERNTISFSKNYRIFTSQQPVHTAEWILSFVENITIGEGNELTNLNRYFRYSTNQENWSLWYDFSPTSLPSSIEMILLDKTKSFFAEIKYEYDNGTSGVLLNPVKINEVKLGLQTFKDDPSQELMTPGVYCSDETCPAIIADRLATFQPYAVDSAIGIYQELCFNTNKMFGQEVCYFRTLPDWKEGDYIFKEWTIFKCIERKCLKVLLNDNNFPDNKPTFANDGVNFSMPFEVHVDHNYFQSIFGNQSEPRKRDFLYFPLVNRMYEIQGSYLFRGFMMAPAYWRVHLKMFNPNIDMIIKGNEKIAVDSLIISSEDMFKTKVKETSEDATNPQQLKTISDRYDEVRSYLNPDMFVGNLGQTYNYGPLIDYYYDMTGITSESKDYTITDTGTSTRAFFNGTPTGLVAYQDSDVFADWMNKAIRTGDLNLNAMGQSYRIRTDGPILDPVLNSEYVIISAYPNMTFIPNAQKNIYQIDSKTVRFKTWTNGVVYKERASLSDRNQNLTFSCLFQANSSTSEFILLRAYNDTKSQGIQIYGSIVSGVLTIYLRLNTHVYTFPVGTVTSGTWYQFFVPVSAQFKQAGLYVYSFKQDQANTTNYNQLVLNYSSNIRIKEVSFEDSDNYSVPSGNFFITNIRIFKTMVQEEDHDYLISQLFIRDESLLYVIDNSRPRLGTPYVTRNR